MQSMPFEETVQRLNELREFLRSAPSNFGPNERIRRYELPNSEVISCIKWEDEFFISGTDILRCIVYRFQAFGREVIKRAKFEEFVFSDLRSLKTNVRARLEEGKSDLLVFLHDYGCIRTKKKQRVFYWDAVPHDQLFLDTLERELRRAVIDHSNNHEHRISIPVREPALSMRYDPLQKVAHQIGNILDETPCEHKCIISAIFGMCMPEDAMVGQEQIQELPLNPQGLALAPATSQVPGVPTHYQVQHMIPAHSADSQYRVQYGQQLALPPSAPQPQLTQAVQIQPQVQPQLLHPHSHIHAQQLHNQQQQQLEEQQQQQHMREQHMRQMQMHHSTPPAPISIRGMLPQAGPASISMAEPPIPLGHSSLPNIYERRISGEEDPHQYDKLNRVYGRADSDGLLYSLKNARKLSKHSPGSGYHLHPLVSMQMNDMLRNSSGGEYTLNFRDHPNLQLPEMKSCPAGSDVDLPSIRDALPVHALTSICDTDRSYSSDEE